MKTFFNFTLAILLLIAFLGSGAFFIMVSNGLKLERKAAPAPPSAPASSATPATSSE